MRARRAQAAIEVVAVIGVVTALVASGAAAGAFAWLPRTVQRAATLADGGPETAPDPGGLAFLDRAIARRPGSDGPLLRDAIARLGRSLGPDAARATAIAHVIASYGAAPPGRRSALADPSLALARPAYDGRGRGTPSVWSEETPRAPTVARLVTASDESRWRDRQRASIAQRVVDLGVSGAIGLAGAINPETSAVAIGIGAGAAALDTAAAGVPAGSRDDDVLVCRFVWRRNRAVAGWAATHPVDAPRLALGRRLPAVELIVVRAGAALSRDVVRSDATAC
ncbi:MAG: hypothetical protein ACR2JV_08705 [Gaiellales bacterium]